MNKLEEFLLRIYLESPSSHTHAFVDFSLMTSGIITALYAPQEFQTLGASVAGAMMGKHVFYTSTIQDKEELANGRYNSCNNK